jgi:uncharacterized protein (DUF2147 family)
MRTKFRFATAMAIAMLTAGLARSASNPDAIPIPVPNPFRTVAPAPSSSKAATPAPSLPKAIAPAPSPSKIEVPAAYDHKTAAGLWQETDDQGRPGAWFLFVEKDGLYEGRFVKMFKQPGEQEMILTCRKCTGDQKDAPMIGLTIVKGMKRDGNDYTGGTILDPRDGTVYHAQMQLSADGEQLFVRGYLGIPLLGQTQTWTRLPDDAIAPDDIPAESHGPDWKPE